MMRKKRNFRGKTVVWKEEDEQPAEEQPAEEQPQQKPPAEEPKKEHTAQKPPGGLPVDDHSLGYIIAVLSLFVLIYLFLYNIAYLFVSLAVVALLYAHFLYRKHKERQYVDNMERQQIMLTLAHPVLTGFEFAMGVGIFGTICIIIGLILVTLFFGSIAYLAYQAVMPYLPF